MGCKGVKCELEVKSNIFFQSSTKIIFCRPTDPCLLFLRRVVANKQLVKDGQMFKGCVCFIFANLFFKSEPEHLSN